MKKGIIVMALALGFTTYGYCQDSSSNMQYDNSSSDAKLQEDQSFSRSEGMEESMECPAKAESGEINEGEAKLQESTDESMNYEYVEPESEAVSKCDSMAALEGT